MDWLAIRVPLQDKNTGAFRVLWIILNYDCLGNTIQYVSHRNIIGREFIVTVARYEHLPSTNQAENLLNRIAHGIALTLSVNAQRFSYFPRTLEFPRFKSSRHEGHGFKSEISELFLLAIWRGASRQRAVLQASPGLSNRLLCLPLFQHSL